MAQGMEWYSRKKKGLQQILHVCLLNSYGSLHDPSHFTDVETQQRWVFLMATSLPVAQSGSCARPSDSSSEFFSSPL